MPPLRPLSIHVPYAIVEAASGPDWSGLVRALRVALLLGVVLLGTDVLIRLVTRELLARRLGRRDPSLTGRLRPMVREAMPLLRWRGLRFSYPGDPFALDTPVVVPPLGDGRPGEHFLAAGPSQIASTIVGPGRRNDATVPLAPGVTLLVVCLGRIGTVWKGSHGSEDEVLLHAEARIGELDRPSDTPMRRVGPVERGVTAVGEAWRHTFVSGTTRVTDTHVDYDGWAFIVGVSSTVRFSGAEQILDGVLSTWRWIPDGGVTRSR